MSVDKKFGVTGYHPGVYFRATKTSELVGSNHEHVMGCEMLFRFKDLVPQENNIRLDLVHQRLDELKNLQGYPGKRFATIAIWWYDWDVPYWVKNDPSFGWAGVTSNGYRTNPNASNKIYGVYYYTPNPPNGVVQNVWHPIFTTQRWRSMAKAVWGALIKEFDDHPMVEGFNGIAGETSMYKIPNMDGRDWGHGSNPTQYEYHKEMIGWAAKNIKRSRVFVHYNYFDRSYGSDANMLRRVIAEDNKYGNLVITSPDFIYNYVVKQSQYWGNGTRSFRGYTSNKGANPQTYPQPAIYYLYKEFANQIPSMAALSHSCFYDNVEPLWNKWFKHSYNQRVATTGQDYVDLVTGSRKSYLTNHHDKDFRDFYNALGIRGSAPHYVRIPPYSGSNSLRNPSRFNFKDEFLAALKPYMNNGGKFPHSQVSFKSKQDRTITIDNGDIHVSYGGSWSNVPSGSVGQRINITSPGTLNYAIGNSANRMRRVGPIALNSGKLYKLRLHMYRVGNPQGNVVVTLRNMSGTTVGSFRPIDLSSLSTNKEIVEFTAAPGQTISAGNYRLQIDITSPVSSTNMIRVEHLYANSTSYETQSHNGSSWYTSSGDLRFDLEMASGAMPNWHDGGAKRANNTTSNSATYNFRNIEKGNHRIVISEHCPQNTDGGRVRYEVYLGQQRIYSFTSDQSSTDGWRQIDARTYNITQSRDLKIKTIGTGNNGARIYADALRVKLEDPDIAGITPPTVPPGQTVTGQSGKLSGELIGSFNFSKGGGTILSVVIDHDEGNRNPDGPTFNIWREGEVRVWREEEQNPGTYTVRFAMVNEAGQGPFQTVTVVLTDSSPVTPPVVAPGQTIIARSGLSRGQLIGTVDVDPGGGTIRTSEIDNDGGNKNPVGPTFAAFHDGTIRSWTRAEQNPGTYSLRLAYANEAGQGAFETVSIILQADGGIPVIASGQTVTSEAGRPKDYVLGHVSITGAPATGAALVAGNKNPVGPTFRINPATGAVIVQTETEQLPGIYPLTVRLTGQGAPSGVEYTFSVMLTPQDDANPVPGEVTIDLGAAPKTKAGHMQVWMPRLTDKDRYILKVDSAVYFDLVIEHKEERGSWRKVNQKLPEGNMTLRVIPQEV